MALCHCQLSYERAHVVFLKSNNCRFQNVTASAWWFTPAKGSIFSRDDIVHGCPLQIYWVSTWPLQNWWQVQSLFFAHGQARSFASGRLAIQAVVPVQGMLLLSPALGQRSLPPLCVVNVRWRRSTLCAAHLAHHDSASCTAVLQLKSCGQCWSLAKASLTAEYFFVCGTAGKPYPNCVAVFTVAGACFAMQQLQRWTDGSASSSSEISWHFVLFHVKYMSRRDDACRSYRRSAPDSKSHDDSHPRLTLSANAASDWQALSNSFRIFFDTICSVTYTCVCQSVTSWARQTFIVIVSSVILAVFCLEIKLAAMRSTSLQCQSLHRWFSQQLLGLSPSFFMLHTKKGCLAFFWMEDLLLDIDCGDMEGKRERRSSSSRWM